MRWLLVILAACQISSPVGAAADSARPGGKPAPTRAPAPGPMALAAPAPVPAPAAPSKLRLARGRVGGGCPTERHATCRGQMVDEFAIDARPVSSEEYKRCVAANRCPAHGAPIDGEEGTHGPGLTVDAGERYCAWRGERLPTEGEWERARLEAQGFEVPARPMIKEVLFGWYTWHQPGGPHIVVSPGNASRLVIRIYQGDSYRYGIDPRRSTPDLTFRCVASRYQPSAPGSPQIAR